MTRSNLVGGFLLVFAASVAYPPQSATAQPAVREQFPSETLLPGYLRDRMQRRVAARRDNAAMTLLMQPLAAEAGSSTVEVLLENERVALGTVVSADGYLISKASELKASGELRVRLADDRIVSAKRVAQRRSVDLVLLKVDVAGLLPIAWSEQEPAVGSFLFSVGRQGDPVGIGVVSVASREVLDRGLLGVMLQTDTEGARVVNIVPGSGADDAGIEIGDLITKVDGAAMATQKQVTDELRALYPGDSVALTVRREGVDDEFELSAEIRELASFSESQDDTRVNGPRNSRLTGFELALQHDTVLGPDQCGGPVIDTSGRVIGINIARAGRVCSYAVPSAAIKPIVAEMLSSQRASSE
ncbi:serine endoprotease [Rosistilla carotiformis]|uniref:Serine endoprotease n=1 Tax=Rosistilla carotiformis TaxID=2528017 RepID=A0A518JZH7_9BACT|nr:PDZ domain-containing protein [Rosistilla carotiformis]QDV70948.1 serine endoprotease [Rosistilla carotiformis]